MTTFVLSPRAQADLDEIWDYSAEQWGEDRAERYVREIARGVETVSRDPRRGRRCDDVRRGYLSYAVGAHILFYRMMPDGAVDIVRILHQRMDFRSHL